MPGWRARLLSQVSNDLAIARGASRRLLNAAESHATDSRAQTARELAVARKKQAGLTATHRRICDNITTRAQNRIRAALDQLTTLTAPLVTGPAACDWASWKPHPLDIGQLQPMLRVGRLAGGVGDKQAQAPAALVALLDYAHLRLSTGAEEVLSTVLLRLLGCTEPGAVHFTVFDPQRLSVSLDAFADLAAVGLLDIIGPQRFSDTIDQYLADIRRISITVLSDKYRSLRELTAATGQSLEPWRVVVIPASVVDNWTPSAHAQLAKIREAGVACGVHLVVVGGDSEAEVDTLVVTQRSTTLTSDVPIVLDDPPSHQLISQTCQWVAEQYYPLRGTTEFAESIAAQPWNEESGSAALPFVDSFSIESRTDEPS